MKRFPSCNIAKYLLTVIITLCTSTFSYAERMSVEDFRHSPKEQQIETIKSLQMFAVNLENMQNNTLKRKYSYKREYKKR